MTKSTVRESAYGWLAGKLIVNAAKLARKRADFHEFGHYLAAIQAGNTGPKSHTLGCALERDHLNELEQLRRVLLGQNAADVEMNSTEGERLIRDLRAALGLDPWTGLGQ
jgi:hypothetical protein